VDWISVEPQHQRQGLATALWQHAQDLGLQAPPKPRRNEYDEGEAWARQVGGRLPRRRSESA
jgi:hypothetical protein